VGIRAVFVDRDGTINVEKHFVHKTEDFELIPGALEALRLLTRHSIDVYIVTNQSGIARGYYTERQFLEFTDEMMQSFTHNGVRIEKVLYCPHLPNGTVPEYSKVCLCRKPNTGLFEQVIGERGYRSDELVLIGDKESDIQAGRRLGIVTYLVLTGYGQEHLPRAEPTYVKNNLLDAVKQIICDQQ
jgi:D-glycero-D-manno-heptose 1,7-bisphosphate phosphatase